MKLTSGIIILFVLICIFDDSIADAEISKFEWIESLPERQGVSSERLVAASLLIEDKGTKALLVNRNDSIILEWYAKGWHKSKKHYTASLAKSLVGGMALALMLNDELLGIGYPAVRFIPQWRNNALKSIITLRMIATHSSGIDSGERKGIAHSQLSGWIGQFWRREQNPYILVRDQVEVVFEPGSQYQYSGPGFAILGIAITEGLRNSPFKDIYVLLKERIMDPIGVPHNEWSISYDNNAHELDDMQLYAIWSGGEYSARAAARVGRLMIRKGIWKERRIINPQWIETLVSYAGTPMPYRTEDSPKPASAICWWTNFDGVWPSLPRDAYVGAGSNHQILLIVPSMDLIVVRFGDSLTKRSGFNGYVREYILDTHFGEQKEAYWEAVERYIFNPIMEAV